MQCILDDECICVCDYFDWIKTALHSTIDGAAKLGRECGVWQKRRTTTMHNELDTMTKNHNNMSRNAGNWQTPRCDDEDRHEGQIDAKIMSENNEKIVEILIIVRSTNKRLAVKASCH